LAFDEMIVAEQANFCLLSVDISHELVWCETICSLVSCESN